MNFTELYFKIKLIGEFVGIGVLAFIFIVVVLYSGYKKIKKLVDLNKEIFIKEEDNE